MNFLERGLFGQWKDRWLESSLPQELLERFEKAPLKLNSAGFDAWGFDPELAKSLLVPLQYIYRDYFRVVTNGLERVPEGRVMLIANHSGQLPWDGLLLGLSLLLEGKPPRLVRGMIERWAPTIPYVGSLLARCGQIVGNPRNCRELLMHDECVMVFPEGIKGIGKPFAKKYQLQRFGTGFVRLALETKTPIVPVGIIGCEEIHPALAHSKLLAKLLRAPYFPITPTFPWLGALGAMPMPSRVTLRFGEPIRLEGEPDAPETKIIEIADRIQLAIQAELNAGLQKRGKDWLRGVGV